MEESNNREVVVISSEALLSKHFSLQVEDLQQNVL